MTRTKVLLIVAPLALCALLLLLVPILLNKDKILELATATLQEKTGATLTVGGDVDLQLLPRIGVSLQDVSLTLPEDEQSELTVRSLQLGLRIMPLFSGRVELDSLNLDGLSARIAAQDKTPQVDTSQLSDRELDDFYAQRQRAQAEAGQAAGAALAIPLALNVETFSLTDSRLELLAAAGAASTVIEVSRFQANDINLEARPVKVQAHVLLQGEQPIELNLKGTVRIDQEQQIILLDALELDVDGIAAQTIALQTHGEVDIGRRVADLQLVMQLANAQGEGSLRYAGFETPAIDAVLHFDQFDPALLALAGPEAASETDKASTGGNDPLPLAALRSIDTRAELTIDRATFDAHTIENLDVKLRAQEGVIQLSSLTGALHGGQLQLQAAFNARHNIATLESTGQLQQLDIATALAAASVKPVVTGRANLNWQLAGKGRTRNELVEALAGTIKLATEQVVLNDISVEQMLCQAVALTNRETLNASFPSNTGFQTLTATIQLADGRALLRPLRAELPQISLSGRGAYKLLSGDFKATFKATLSPELETLDPACRVSKRLTAIDWPVDCKGNASGEPSKWCRVDTQEIMEDLTKNEAERKLKKEAGKLLDKLFNK